MAQDINLLPNQTVEVTPQVQQQKKLTVISAAVLILTIVVVVALFAGKLALQANANSLDNDIATQTSKVQSYKEVEGVYRALDAKLTTLSSFLSDQKHFSTFLTKFSQTVPASLRLSDMTVDSSNKATVTGTVTTYSDLAGFYDKLRSLDAADSQSTSPYFTDPALVSIGRDDQSSAVTFTMSFGVTKKALTAQVAASPTPSPTPSPTGAQP